MREVLGFSAQECADLLETSVQSVNSALQRARKTVDEKLPEQTQQESLRALGDDAVKDVVQSFVESMERGDVDGVVALLAEDAEWCMPPLTSWYRGTPDITKFLARWPLSGELEWRRVVGSTANGQVAVAGYIRESGTDEPFGASVLDILSLNPDGRIAAVTSFGACLAGNPEWTKKLLKDFGFPETVPA